MMEECVDKGAAKELRKIVEGWERQLKDEKSKPTELELKVNEMWVAMSEQKLQTPFQFWFFGEHGRQR